VLIFAGGGGGDSGADPSGQTSPLQNRFLKETVAEADRGISVRRPANWRDTEHGGVIALQSHDHCLAMSLSAPRGADRAKELRSDSIALLKRSLGNARVLRAWDTPVGGIPTTSDALAVSDQAGNPIRVLLSVGTGHKYAYLTEIVVRDSRCQGDLQLGQVVLGSIRYSK